MPLSVTEPINEAFARTGQILFKPFVASKWFKLGFCAFLVQLADCSGGNSGSSWDPTGNGRGHEFQHFKDWLGDNLAMVVTVGLIVGLIVLAIWVTLMWLQARGRFMFLDGVVKDRGSVVEPWHEFRAEGNSLFRFSLVLNFAGLFLALAAIGIGLLLAWSDLDRGRFEGGAVAGLFIGGTLMFVTIVVFALIGLFLNDFVVPAMYKRRIGVMQGWRTVSAEILRAHTGTTALYVLVKIVIAIIAGLLTITVMCGTLGLMCCLLIIPYIGTVVLLPLLVFDRCYSVAFLEQLGQPWLLEPAQDEQAMTPA